MTLFCSPVKKKYRNLYTNISKHSNKRLKQQMILKRMYITEKRKDVRKPYRLRSNGTTCWCKENCSWKHRPDKSGFTQKEDQTANVMRLLMWLILGKRELQKVCSDSWNFWFIIVFGIKCASCNIIYAYIIFIYKVLSQRLIKTFECAAWVCFSGVGSLGQPSGTNWPRRRWVLECLANWPAHAPYPPWLGSASQNDVFFWVMRYIRDCNLLFWIILIRFIAVSWLADFTVTSLSSPRTCTSPGSGIISVDPPHTHM